MSSMFVQCSMGIALRTFNFRSELVKLNQEKNIQEALSFLKTSPFQNVFGLKNHETEYCFGKEYYAIKASYRLKC